MKGIRHKKKEETKERILTVAKELFLEHGYEETPTDEIARRANIGAGTVFNYFDSKADLMIEAFVEDFMTELDENEDILKDIDQNKAASDLVYNYIYRRLHRYLAVSKKVIRPLINVSLSKFMSKPERLKKMVDLDFMFVDELIGYLNTLKEKRLLAPEFNTNQAAEVIYSSLAFEFLLYVYQEELAKEALLYGMKEKIDFIMR